MLKTPIYENNLYGHAMSQSLPVSEFIWLSDFECETFDVSKVDENDKLGYILEVDLEYPYSLHDDHSDYPLAPEKVTVSNYSINFVS